MRRSGSAGRNVASAPPSCDDPRRIRARISTACRNRSPHSKGEFRRRSWQVAWLSLLGLSDRPIGRSRQPLSCHNGLNEPNNRTKQAPAGATEEREPRKKERKRVERVARTPETRKTDAMTGWGDPPLAFQ